ncbi:hypothetical protein [Flectobacillus major]|nr:hypothetical protein [Flectobacillus major]
MNNPHKQADTKAFVLYWEEAFAQSFFHVENYLMLNVNIWKS